MIGARVELKTSDGGTTYTINNRAAQPLLQAQSPYYYIALESADGLYGSDISYESYPIPQATGESSGDVFRRGKTITLSGIIYGLNLAALYTGANYLKQMCQDTGKRRLQYFHFGDPTQIYNLVRITQDLSITEQVRDFEPVLSWTVGLRADDPRTYRVSDSALYPSWQV